MMIRLQPKRTMLQNPKARTVRRIARQSMRTVFVSIIVSAAMLFALSLCLFVVASYGWVFPRFPRNQLLASPSSLHAKTYKVTIQHEGKDTTIDVRDNCSILDAALDAGIDLPHDCKLGVCLTCPSKIISGKVDQSDGTLEDSVQAKGYALTCVSFPCSDVVVRSIEEDELVSAQFSRNA